ncbi:MAG: CopG family transcriptional regulator [Pseudomonadales bacterium]|jgi:hypothetical protein|nr:CopG family transcriptional regulator [Pseudomonadales bacterium]MDP7596717.1 CopG family transcriptional regulator [Pseudomonadales bacterium]HJN51331.1 CopG family transcriptional regulator [Pseudomonadales bacterium]|tara:strand:+ start:111 stop:344 length:234 start_codon:yes stop_codon:yes gene_type:complete
MAGLTKRSTIYFDPDIHKALKLRAASSDTSISELVDEAARILLLEDQEDLKAVRDRVKEPTITYEALLKDLKRHGKI